MSSLNLIGAVLRRGYNHAGYGVVVVARWHWGLKLAVGVGLLVVYWALGWAIGAQNPAAWRLASLPVDGAAILLWGTVLGLCFIAGNLVLTYGFLALEGLAFAGGWIGPLMALVLGIVTGLLRGYIIHLHDVHGTHADTDGMVAICSHCKRIRDGGGDWQQVDHYVEAHSALEFTHGLCPACLQDEMQRFDQTG